MTKFARFALVPALILALSACAKSDSAKEEAQPDNVEMPAEEAVGDLDAGATPAADTGATAAASPADKTAPSSKPAPQ